MTDITTIKRALARRAQDVASLLLPRGRKEGHEWRAGSVFGEEGTSLAVHISGPKAGVWKDFAASGEGSGGDLIDLWVATKKITLREALTEAKEYLGIVEHKLSRPEPRAFNTPRSPARAPVMAIGEVGKYLTQTRAIPMAEIVKYQIAKDEKANAILFPFLDRAGELALVKRRPLNPGPKEAKIKPTEADCKPILFGWQAIDPNAREITLVEGELDAPSMSAYGRPALSVPFGGGAGKKQQWIEHEFENLEQFDKIYLALDDDPVGEEAAVEIASRLGRHRCYRVHLPRKDANECLVDGVARPDVDKAFEEAETLDPEELTTPTQYSDAVESLFYPENDEPEGYMLPYRRIGHQFQCRPGELTIWSGYTGDGKSQVLGDCCVDWVRQGAMTCIASLEMHPRYTLKRMVKQATGMDVPSRAYLKSTLLWLNQGIVLYEKVGKSDVDSMLSVFEYARAKYGCDMFVVDSLMRMNIASDDYAGQERLIYRLVDWTVKNNVHVHVVAHSRKPDGRSHGPQNTHDVKGAQEITANAANVIIIWRNKKDEKELLKAQQSLAKADCEEMRQKLQEKVEELENKPNVVLTLDKQRNGDYTGTTGLFFDIKNYRYRSAGDRDRDYGITVEK